MVERDPPVPCPTLLTPSSESWSRNIMAVRCCTGYGDCLYSRTARGSYDLVVNLQQWHKYRPALKMAICEVLSVMLMKI